MPDAATDQRIIYKGLKIDLALQKVQLSNGSYANREVVLHPGAVALLVELPEDRICLIKNRRYSVRETLIEVPAGTMDPTESPEETAVRELREETGYTGGTIERLGEGWVSPGVFNERMILFRVRGAQPGTQELQPDEELENLIVTWAEALAMVTDGRIHDAKTMIALLIGSQRR